MKTRYGCLTLLGLLAAVTAVNEWTADEPSDKGAALTMMGLFALGAIYVVSAIEWLIARGKREARGFPIEPNKTDRQP
jgi:hypothetical protein